MDDLDVALNAIEEAYGKLLLIDQTILPLDSAMFIRMATAQVEQAKASVEYAALQRTRELADRQRGR